MDQLKSYMEFYWLIQTVDGIGADVVFYYNVLAFPEVPA